MNITKPKVKNIVFLMVILLVIIPQTRQPIQVFLHKGLALFSPSKIKVDEQLKITNYNWMLKDQNEVVFDFETARGKVIIINFWATWCPPCIAEMPNFEKLYGDYKDKVEFIFVSNELKSDIRGFLAKNKYTFKVYKPVSEYPEFFDVTSIPRTFLIDKDGNILIDKTGAANWNGNAVRETLDNLLK